MKKHSQSVFGRGSLWHHAALALLALTINGSANAGSEDIAFDWTGTYAGIFVGSGRADNRIVDVDGFANWGHPGSAVDYDDAGFAGGALMGKKFDIRDIPFRIEIDGTFGGLSANTNRLDPEGLDETAETKLRWVATARGGIEKAVGPATVFATGGLAAARVNNSVTDIDFSADMPPRLDADDSFRDGSTETGWVIGTGVEVLLADVWTLRLEGSYLDFGRSTNYVNHSGDNRCGPDKPRRPCPYTIENNLSIVRLAIIRRFGL